MLGRHDTLESLAIPAGKVVLHASLAVPPGAVGLAIFVHGSGSNRTSPRNRYVAEALRARGLATMLFDLLTPAEDAIDQLDASLRFDVELLAERLVAVIDWVLRESNVAHLAIGLFGASTGAAAALLAAARRSDVVRSVVSRGGRPDLAGNALPAVRAPTLFVVGGSDEDVLELNREAIDRMTAPTQLAIVPGATHLFEEPGALDEVAQLAGEWLVDHFVRPHVPQQWGRQFHDRRTAGARLATSLLSYAGARPIVFGLPRGGVPVADEIAKALDAPLDVWLVRKIGLPMQPELGMGAIAEGAALVLDPMIVRWSGASPDDIRLLVHRKAAEIRRRARMYRGDRPAPDVRGKTAILVDDGIATGGTLRAAIHGARKRGAARVVIAAPVAAAEAVAALRHEADDVVCLSTPENLMAVGAWYVDFQQTTDQEVIDILGEARERFEHHVRPATAAGR